MFKKGNADADFNEIVKNPRGRLLIFNENFKDRKSLDKSEGTTAVVRPYATDPRKPRCAVGVITGWTSGAGGGFRTFAKDSDEQVCVDLSLDRVWLVARHVGAEQILFSAEPNGKSTRPVLGFGIFASSICDPAKDHINQGIRDLPNRGERRGLHRKTIQDIEAEEAKLQAKLQARRDGGGSDREVRFAQGGFLLSLNPRTL